MRVSHPGLFMFFHSQPCSAVKYCDVIDPFYELPIIVLAKMPIMPMWPNLQPRATDPLWFNADRPCDDESDVVALEAEHEAWKEQMRGVGCEQIPIGKSASDFRGSEEEEEEEEEEEGEGEEEEESDTHEEEEEEFDDIDMEVSYTHQQQRSSPTDTVTDPVSIRMVSSHATRYS